jgi:ribosomal protein L40E
MATRRTASTSLPSVSADGTQKLRQTQAQYSAARPMSEPGVKTMMSSSKMYVCRRCQANFKTGDGKPDPRLRGLGKCNRCLAQTPVAA